MVEATYLGNPNLKKANVQQEWTKEELLEYSRCMEDPLHFIQNYVKIIDLFNKGVLIKNLIKPYY